MTELARREDVRAGIINLEHAILAMPDAMSAEEIEKTYNMHYFASGVYARAVTVPAGMYMVGKTHKHAHINIVAQGKIKVVSEFGESIIEAPAIFISEPGIKRAGYAIEETTWITLHSNPSNTRDLREIERDTITEDFRLGEVS